uniref:MORN repeat-containing protein n=1 Tax=Trepomonas sp. PC1 TaxID=1076344 RepID=A0A146K7F5_9EUKA|eukprot:JAP92318.1 MORN repeat-containing protein [Trepomonas sp. PC1]
MKQQLQLPDGQYEGDVLENQRHGFGIFVKKNKETYSGQWQDDKMCGKGKYEYSNNSIYDGQWANNKREGQGVYTLEDGSKYDGQWQADKFIQGTFSKGSSFYTGNFDQNGALNGKVVSRDERGDFEGEYSMGFPVFGEIRSTDYYYKGYFNKFSLHGSGLEIKRIQQQTEIFLGNFENNLRKEGYFIAESGRVTFQIFQNHQLYEQEIRLPDQQLQKQLKHFSHRPTTIDCDQMRLYCFQLGRLQSPFVTQIHFMKEQKALFYQENKPLTQFSQEFIKNNSLKWMLQLMITISEMQSYKLQNGALNPENLFVDPKNRIQLGLPGEAKDDLKQLGKLWFWMMSKDLQKGETKEERCAWGLWAGETDAGEVIQQFEEAEFYQQEVAIHRNLKTVK